MSVLILIHSPFAMWNIPLAHVERLRREFAGHTFHHARTDEEAVDLIRDATVAFSSQINVEHLRAARRLEWVHSPAAGIAGMVYAEMVASPVVLTNSRGLSGDTIAEHVLAVTLALFRRLPLAFARQAARAWAQDEIGAPPGNRTIAGSRVVVIGAGAIGAATATRMHALGATVTLIRRRPDQPSPAGIVDVRAATELATVLPEADVLVVAAPQTRTTRGLLGRTELALMRSDAVLVNVSRGGLLDESALADALAHGRLGGAALDVFRREPLEADNPLWTLPNVLITPHTSGFRADHWDAATALFADNLRRFESGAPLRNIVDKSNGY